MKPDQWIPRLGEDYRVGLPTKVIYKAMMHYAYGDWEICKGDEDSCTGCSRRLYKEMRYCLPVVAYSGKGWTRWKVGYWEIGHGTSKALGRILKESGKVDILILDPKNKETSATLSACEGVLLEGHVSEADIRAQIENLLPSLPRWPGYKKPEPPPLNRLRLILGG